MKLLVVAIALFACGCVTDKSQSAGPVTEPEFVTEGPDEPASTDPESDAALDVIPLGIAESGGRLSLEVVYAYGKNAQYSVSYTTQIADALFKAAPKTVQYNFFNSNNARVLDVWKPVEKSYLRSGTIHVTATPVLATLLTQQENVDLVFAFTEANGNLTPKYLIPLSDYCTATESSNFKNLTDPKKKCFEIKPADIAQAQALSK